MKKIAGALAFLILIFMFGSAQGNKKPGSESAANMIKTIFITGGDFGKPFLQYIAGLTKKENPRICFLPTASADNPYAINWWYDVCADLPVRPYVQRLFISAYNETKTFEETLLSMDAIFVGGGNTLNMLAVWKAQGIDTVLKKAYDRGIVLSGGSAGSLCWFSGGPTDSRPKVLTLIDCLGFLPESHCPHYHSEETRKPIYQNAVVKGQLKPGYACDDSAALLFQNGKLIKAVSLNKENNAYYISVADGKIREELLPAEIIK